MVKAAMIHDILTVFGALHDHLLLGANDCSFSNLLAANGGWDIDKLSNTFMAEAINHIISIKGPDPSNADDMIFGV
ncbi:hypothetical protein V6N13_043366 [Hibiscus sabdariffa]